MRPAVQRLKEPLGPHPAMSRACGADAGEDVAEPVSDAEFSNEERRRQAPARLRDGRAPPRPRSPEPGSSSSLSGSGGSGEGAPPPRARPHRRRRAAARRADNATDLRCGGGLQRGAAQASSSTSCRGGRRSADGRGAGRGRRGVLGVRAASGVETFGGEDLKRAGGGVDGRGGVRSRGGDVAPIALTAAAASHALRARAGGARCGLRTWNDRPSGCGKPAVIMAAVRT